MKRVLLICLSLALLLVGWTSVCADDGFYVISGTKPNYAPVPKTGQTTPYDTRDDGTLHKGVAWPSPRFTDNNNGTITDNLTGLIWTKNAYAIQISWSIALSFANELADGSYGLKDGSKEGYWRLPNVRELQSLVDYGFSNPALPNTLGTGKWTEGNPFTTVASGMYWTSTTNSSDTDYGVFVNMSLGQVGITTKSANLAVWCVRGGK
jgi:hypothetical protein